MLLNFLTLSWRLSPFIRPVLVSMFNVHNRKAVSSFARMFLGVLHIVILLFIMICMFGVILIESVLLFLW